MPDPTTHATWPMKELQFVAARQEQWNRWDRWLAQTGRRRAHGVPGDAGNAGDQPPFRADELAHGFRLLCRDLSLARDRNYSSTLVDALEERVLLAHQRLYGARGRGFAGLIQFVSRGFPAAVRREWRVVLLATLLFLGSMIAMLVLAQHRPDSVYALVPESNMEQFEAMYRPQARHPGAPLDGFSRYAFYVAHNVRIDFQCFAGGIAFGIGAIFYLLYNGLFAGAIAGHLTQLGYVHTFWGFVAGHSGPELMAAILSGACGLKLGWALVVPGARSRRRALVENARAVAPILYGAATMTVLAASIEAYWSPLDLPFPLKIGVGIALWLAFVLYFLAAGARPQPSGAP